MSAPESRCLSWARTHGREDPAAPLPSAQEAPTRDPRVGLDTVCKPLLDFAQKMSEEIISQALLLCWERKIRYSEFPYIDSEQECAL